MEYRDMMQESNENLGWCKPLSWEDGNVVLAINEGTIAGIQIGGESVSVNQETIKSVAQRINDMYDDCSGLDDAHIILDCADEAEELPCRLCPWFDVCDAMDEETGETPEYTED